MKIYSKITNISRINKSIIIIISDTISCYLSYFLCLKIFSLNFLFTTKNIPLLIVFPIIIIIISYLLSIHRFVLQAIEIKSIYKFFIYSIIVGFIQSFIVLAQYDRIEFYIFVILTNNFLVFVIVSRIIALLILNYLGNKSIKTKDTILIYGAGETGRQLLNSLGRESNISIKGFVDDNPNLVNTVISGKKVFTFKDLSKFFKSSKFSEIWIAAPSESTEKKQKMINQASEYTSKIRFLPSTYELLLSGDIKGNLTEVSPEKFLGRDKINIDEDLFSKAYLNKSILITGSGGSIGSEISVHLAKINTNKIILLDSSEYSLYQIERKLLKIPNISKDKIFSYLGSVENKKLISGILKNHSIEIIIHAAAYKHVPMVQKNVIQTFENNVKGTRNLLELSNKFKIKNFILISTDKAVRPTNIMGASKRASELLVKYYSQKQIGNSYTIVRFGNVLGSSGSVIPLFQEQIMAGGPVTITHEEMTRYFMSLHEATQLVLLAGSFLSNGDTFLLDMGKPIKIVDLVKNMIKLSNLTVKDNNIGDIEIKVIGKRPGEKLFEELLINNKSEKTSHKKIFKEVEGNDNDAKMFYSEFLVLEKNLTEKTIIEFFKRFCNLSFM